MLTDALAWLGIGQWDFDEKGRRRPGAWSQAFTGTQYWSLDPREDEIHFDDICMGLREPRYRGQTRELYSVLTHSVLVSIAAEKYARDWLRDWPLRSWIRGEDFDRYNEAWVLAVAREALMHDASEAYIGDVARPLKHQRIMRGYRRLEAKWERAIYKRFDITPTEDTTRVVKMIDNRIVLDEVEALMIDPDMWSRNNRYPNLEPLDIEIPDWTWRQSVDAFCQRFTELWEGWPEVTYARKHAEQNPLLET